jgi:protein gp37
MDRGHVEPDVGLHEGLTGLRSLLRRADGLAVPKTFPNGFDLTLRPDTLDLLLHWRRPRTIFVNSMSDLFHVEVRDAYIAQVFDVMAKTPQHTYQVLTKRAERLERLAPRLPWPPNVWEASSSVPSWSR